MPAADLPRRLTRSVPLTALGAGLLTVLSLIGSAPAKPPSRAEQRPDLVRHASAAQVEGTMTIDSFTPVLVRTVDASGNEILPPVRERYWQTMDRAMDGEAAMRAVSDLRDRIDRAEREHRPLEAVLHEWADGRRYGAFGKR